MVIWEVVGVVYNGKTIEISLIGAASASSLADQAKKRNQSVNKLVSKYCLVEVDFGHKVNSGGIDGVIDVNKWDMSTHLPTEMYKKRPCVVLAIEGNCIQVVPLTTAEHATPDKYHVEVTASSFNNLHSRYKNKSSYLLTKMIQTVSAYRVYPPKLNSGKFASSCNPFKLCSADKTSLLKALASIYSYELVKEHER